MNNANAPLIYEYQQLLLGNSIIISPFFFDKNKVQAEKTALIVIRYLIEDILHWTPEMMRYHFNKEIIDTFKLNRIISYIEFPPETDREDYFVYAYKLYPNEIILDRRTLTILMYNKIIDKKITKFPKGFFDDDLGRVRATICLNYLLSQKEHFGTVENIYEFFSTQKGKDFLKRYRLDLVQHNLWDTPLDYLHDSLSPEDRNEIFYQLYRFSASYMKNIPKNFLSTKEN